MELQKLIKLLLATNNFVSLPGLGSFIVTYKPAQLSADSQTFEPPKEFIRFDTLRTFNDEALENALVDSYGFSKTDSQEAVKKFVNEVELKLKQGKSIFFDGVGMLSKGSDGSIVFSAEDESSRISSTYGLTDIRVEPIKTHEKGFTATPKQHVPSSPKVASEYNAKRYGRAFYIGIISGVLILLAVAASFLLIPEFRFWNYTKPVQTIAQVSVDYDTAQLVHSDTAKLEKDSLDVIEAQQGENVSLPVDLDKKAALYYEEPVMQQSKTFYIISGSFERIENAQIHLEKLEAKGFRPEILKSNGRYRVAMLKYTDRNRALRELDRLRKEKPNESVWLLGL
ncbi:MAG TPA: SPOR domain-containing protein [Tenuifilaceae bacterium]|nr:SPOR domain-containing protein [Tenuifilaceae bacterium]